MSQLLNPYFSNVTNVGEQRIIEDLIVESIKIMGFAAYYCPNDNEVARDLLYGEDPVKKFESAFPLEMYLSTVMDYGGEKDFFTKFGLEIKNNITVICSKRSFAERVPSNAYDRPKEGDLVYVPFLNGTGELFEIKFANQTKDMSMFGRKVEFFYELELQEFKYSHELLSTGIDDIDTVSADNSYKLDLILSSGTGDYTFREVVFQSPDNTLANATSSAITQTWDYVTQILQVTMIKGVFVDGGNIIGDTNGANWVLSNYDTLQINDSQSIYDNGYIQEQGLMYVDTTETNPLGSL